MKLDLDVRRVCCFEPLKDNGNVHFTPVRNEFLLHSRVCLIFIRLTTLKDIGVSSAGL